MTPERWQLIEDIFHSALEMEGDERARFIEERVAGDAALKSEVEHLIAQFEEASGFIEQPIIDSSRTGMLSSLLDDSDEDPMIGTVLGNYLIEREIGRGGMGAVYQATRADGEFRLAAAIKVVKRGVDTDFVLRRFRNERQILAALDHPFITRLIDGGTTADGRPYFVMDLIDGRQLYQFADQERLSTRARVELLVRLCEAVEYAHKRRVIHRDLKPSNIFVTADGSPKLLDFGIAKLLDPELALDTLQPTATALRMMTVDYASPEQIRGEKVSVSTDIYSLGVIAYELLSGRRPYRVASRDAHSVSKAICDTEPPRLSKAFADDSQPAAGASRRAENAAVTKQSIAELRDSTPAALERELAGDLEKIVARALRKTVSERHSSITELREDLCKYLAGESVEVPEYFAYREPEAENSSTPDKKLVAVLPLSLLSPSKLDDTDAAYLRIGLADAIITHLARVRQLTVRPTSSIAGYDLETLNPFRAGRELGVDFVVDGRIRRFGERLRVSLQLLDVKKGSAIWAGHFDERLTEALELEDAISAQVVEALIPQLTGAERRHLQRKGTRDPRAFDAYMRGRFYWNQFTADSLQRAAAAFRSAIEIDPDYALAYVGLADIQLWSAIYGLIEPKAAYEVAEKAARRALELDDRLGEAYASMGLIYNNHFRYRDAEKAFQKALALQPGYALANEWYGAHLISVGRPSEGLRSMERAEELDPLSLRTKVLLVWYRYQTHQFEAAKAKAREVIELEPAYFQGHLQLGLNLVQSGEPAEAVAEFRRALELMPDSDLAECHAAFGFAAAGEKDEAIRLRDKLRERARVGYVKPFFLAFAELAAGDTDAGFEQLSIAVDEFDPWITWLRSEPFFDAIRDDPRFVKLVARTTGNDTSLGAEGLFDPGTSINEYDAETLVITGSQTREARRPRAKVYGLAALAVCALIAAGIGIAHYTGLLTLSFSRSLTAPSANASPAAAASSTLAVLPFVNATGNAANDYLVSGIGADLADRLAESESFRVISGATIAKFKGSTLSPDAVGRQVNADIVLTGEVTAKGTELFITIDLVRSSDGRKDATYTFAESPDKIAAVQKELVAKIAAELGAGSTPSDVRLKSYTEDGRAFDLYLKGEYYRQKGTPDDTRAAIDFYDQAIAADPNFALAYQGLSLAYRSAPDYGAMQPDEAFGKARASAQKALEIDPELAPAYVSLAAIKATYDWDFKGAEAEYKRAVELAPNNAEARYSYGNFLVAMDRPEEAMPQYRIAQQADPLNQTTALSLGWALYIAGRYDEAIEQDNSIIQRNPTYARGYLSLGEVLQEQGKYDEAIAAIQKARSLSKDPLTDMALGHVLATAGRRNESQKIAIELEDRVRSGQVSPFLPAVVYAGLNEKDKAFYWLERSYQEHSNWLTLLKVGRRLKNLHDDPRYADLLRRIGFES